MEEQPVVRIRDILAIMRVLLQLLCSTIRYRVRRGVNLLRRFRNRIMHAYFNMRRLWIQGKIMNIQKRPFLVTPGDSTGSIFRHLVGEDREADSSNLKVHVLTTEEIGAYVRELIDKLDRINKIEAELFDSASHVEQEYEGEREGMLNLLRSVQALLGGGVVEHSSVRGELDMQKHAKPPLTIDSVDFDNEEEMEALDAQVLEEGRKNLHANIQEAIRLGIIDEKGNLLKTELPPDMREGAETDFGG